jgi:hypothetical protein
MKNTVDLQQAIFYCMENYDNWREIPVFYQKDISKDKTESIAFHADIDFLRYENENFVFSSSHFQDETTMALESLSEMIDEMRENEQNWVKKLKFESEMEFEFETHEEITINSEEDFDEIKDFFVNEECFILIGE